VQHITRANKGNGAENRPGNDQRIHAMPLLDQPRHKCLMLGLASLAHKVLAELPVGAVQDAHAGEAFCRRDGNHPAS
jgi:hypothetical protein